MMGRLTKLFEKENQKYVCIDVCGEKCVEGYSACPDCEPFTNVLKKLARYEDLEEQGLLMKLPCKVGKNLYDITEFIEGYDSPDVFLIDTSRIEISKDKEGLIYTIDCVDYREKDFGTTLFTSEDEALKTILEKGWIL